MRMPRFGTLTWIILLSIAALVILAGHDLSIRLGGHGPGDAIAGMILLFLLFGVVFGPIALFAFVVLLANRSSMPPPPSESRQRPDRIQFKIRTLLIIVLVVALVMGAGVWLVRNS